MREDEISRYTADSDVLDMMDFRDIPADELEGTEDYIDAQATVAEGIHDALRAAQWAKIEYALVFLVFAVGLRVGGFFFCLISVLAVGFI